jgi:carbohydrate diacid regulator
MAAAGVIVRVVQRITGSPPMTCTTRTKGGQLVISARLAQEIASETSGIIGYNVVITDRDGIVLGSGDQSRVGSFHEASLDVVRTERPAAHTAEQARLLTGVRPGVTLPVFLDGEVVGTVGLTGAPAQVRRFGLVVRHQTELLLREASLITSRLVREKAVTDLLQDITHHDPAIVDPAEVAAAASELGFDLRLPRVALVVDVERVPAERVPAVLRSVHGLFHEAQDMVGAVGRSHIAVFHRLRPPSPTEDLLAVARSASEALVEEHGTDQRVGLGGTASGVAGLRDSYADALAAVRLAPRAAGVAPIADYRLQQLLATLGVGARARFVAAVLGELPGRSDWDVLRTTLVAWAEHGFHLVRTAEALHVHRNTLVYRLQKIDDILGRSLRDHRHAVAVYLACLAHEQSARAPVEGAQPPNASWPTA